MHVLTAQSYLNDAMENEPPSADEALEKVVFESHSQVLDRSNTVGVRQEAIAWDLRRNSTSSLRNNWKLTSDSKSKYMSPPLSLASSNGTEETKSVVSNTSSGLAAHLQKRWSTDVPIRPLDKPSEWQTKAIS